MYMEKKLWYGFSKTSNQTHFFNSDPGRNAPGIGELSGTGSFTVNGECKGLNIENVQNQAGNQRQTDAPVG
jgi:hypothetical protein